MSPDVCLECLTDLLRHNRSNLQPVVQVPPQLQCRSAERVLDSSVVVREALGAVLVDFGNGIQYELSR